MTNYKCRVCHVPKPFDQFPRNAKLPDARDTRCKECTHEYYSEYRRKNATKINAYFREYMTTVYRDKHAEDVRRWTDTHREKRREIGRNYYKRNPDRYNARKRHWRKLNPDKAKEMARQGQIKHRLERRTYEATRRARKNSVFGRHNSRDIKRLFAAQNGQCFWCKRDMAEYHVDHVMPLSKGGNNTPDNIVLACPNCNMRKKDKDPESWLAVLAREGR